MILTKYLFNFSVRLTEQSVTTVAGNACWNLICVFAIFLGYSKQNMLLVAICNSMSRSEIWDNFYEF